MPPEGSEASFRREPEIGLPDTPVIWLPNDQELILNKLNDLVIYNIETGEQRSIGDPGTVLGTIEIK